MGKKKEDIIALNVEEIVRMKNLVGKAVVDIFVKTAKKIKKGAAIH
ncbi:hypothetical protein ACI2OX_11975 [Bacillus sp. N9]